MVHGRRTTTIPASVTDRLTSGIADKFGTGITDRLTSGIQRSTSRRRAARFRDPETVKLERVKPSPYEEALWLVRECGFRL